jgi:Protein of unknown function (DUF3175)
MSMLTFYINRAGKNLSDERKRVLESAKNELRKEFGRCLDEESSWGINTFALCKINHLLLHRQTKKASGTPILG